MRIALLHPCYWPEVRRGSERLIHDLGAGLAAGGDEVRLLTSHRHLPTRRVEDGMTVVRSYRPPEGPLRRRGVQQYLTHLPFTARELARGQDDIAHGFYVTDGVAAARWGRDTGRPVAFTWTGLPNRRALASRWLGPKVIDEATRGADAVITLSAAARDALWRWLRVESRIIPPGVDTDAFAPGPGRSPVPQLLCPSALGDARKRGDLLLAAFARLHARDRDLELVLQRPADPAVATELEATPGVVLADLDDRAVLRDAYRRAWCTVLASRDEAFGLVLAESLACGTPGVCSSDGGSAEVLGDQATGERFDGDDPEVLAAAIAAVLARGTGADVAGACRERALTFSQAGVTAAHRDLYEDLLHARR